MSGNYRTEWNTVAHTFIEPISSHSRETADLLWNTFLAISISLSSLELTTKSHFPCTIQTAVSSHCCSQKKPSKALGSILRGSGGAPAPKLSRHLMRTLPGACNANNTAEIYILHIYTLSHKHTHTHFMIVQMHNHKFYLIYLSFFYPTICFFVCF